MRLASFSQKTGYDLLLEEASNFTVFAPRNSAWDGIEDSFYGWFNILVGFLDLVLAYFLLAFGPETSITLVMALIGIQLILSSITILSIASAIKRMTR